MSALRRKILYSLKLNHAVLFLLLLLKTPWHHGQMIHINCARFSFSEQCTKKIKTECAILKKAQAIFQLSCMLLSQGNVLNKSLNKIEIFHVKDVFSAIGSVFIVAPEL